MLYERSRLLVPWFLPVFVFLSFVLHKNYFWSMFFYVVGVPFLLYLIWARRRIDGMASPIVWVALALIGWSILTLAWGVDQPPVKIWRYAGGGVATAAYFLLGLALMCLNGRQHAERVMLVMVVGAVLNVLISFGVFIHHFDGVAAFDKLVSGKRLTGWGETQHEILGSDIMAVASVMAAYFAIASQRTAHRLLYSGSVVLILLFILATGSRGPLLAVAVALSILVFLSCRRCFAVGAILLIGAAAVAYFAVGPVQDWVTAMMNRPSLRLEIWQAALVKVANHPIFGHGIANSSTFSVDFVTFPHNLFLSALYYSGIVGLLLLVALLVMTFRAAARETDRGRRRFFIAVLSIPIVAGMTDIGQVVRAPSEIWLILWLPLILVIGTDLARAAEADAEPDAGVRPRG